MTQFPLMTQAPPMNRCPQCNERNPSKGKSCLHCGALLQRQGPSKQNPLYTTRTLDNGTLEVRGPLATAIGMVALIGFGVLLYLMIFTDRFEPIHERCFPFRALTDDQKMLDQGYVYSHRDIDKGYCYRRTPTKKGAESNPENGVRLEQKW